MAELTYGQLPVDIDPTAWFGRTYTPPIGLDISTIQNAISGQLVSFLQPLNIPSYIFPQFDLDTWWKSQAIAFTLIAYRDTAFSKPLDTSTMVQERTLGFSIIVAGRTVSWELAGPGSMYALIDAIEASLTGFRPSGCRNGYFEQERFLEQDPTGRVWLYEMQYKIVTIRPKLLPEYALANLQQITNLIYDGQGGTPSAQTISGAGTIQLSTNTVVLSVVNASNVEAVLGVDYLYSSVSGLLTITDSGLLTIGETVTVATAPIVDTQTIT